MTEFLHVLAAESDQADKAFTLECTEGTSVRLDREAIFNCGNGKGLFLFVA